MPLACVGPAAFALPRSTITGVLHAGGVADSILDSIHSADLVLASRGLGHSNVHLAITSFLVACFTSCGARMVAVEPQF